MIKYAILGFGTVGGGLAEVMEDQKETIAAMLEAERIAHDPSVKHNSDV